MRKFDIHGLAQLLTLYVCVFLAYELIKLHFYKIHTVCTEFSKTTHGTLKKPSSHSLTALVLVNTQFSNSE